MSDSSFQLRQNWFPVAPLVDVPDDRPLSVTIAGVAIAIWKPRESADYRAALDRCPHRSAPLSEGRIDEESGNLMCSYHGWQFGEDGQCTRIPQAPDPEILDRTPQSFCLTTLPVQVEQDLLWVWPDAASTDLAATKPLPLSPQIPQMTESGRTDATRNEVVCSGMVRELAYDWQTLIENLADPSHVPFAHHGVQGNRKSGSPTEMTIEQSTADCLDADVQSGPFKSRLTFVPPCLLEYRLDLGGGRSAGLVSYCMPTTPGKSRIVAQFPRNFAQKAARRTPRWVEHLKVRNEVLDGDMVLLKLQERWMRGELGEDAPSWQAEYTMPTTADRMVIEFRRWFDEHADALLRSMTVDVPRAVELPSREVLLDRYIQHSKLCSSCRDALAGVQLGQKVALLVFALILAIGAIFSGRIGLVGEIVMFVLAIGSLGIYGGLKYWLEPKFYFVDYIHAER